MMIKRLVCAFRLPLWVTALLLFVSPLSIQAQQAGKIKGKLPQIAYSTGADRLGSAKMGYIDTGIMVQLVDTIDATCTIRLAAGRIAYLDTMFIDSIHTAVAPPPALMEAWRIAGSDKQDSVFINLSRKVIYKSWMDNNPATLHIELYNVQSNTNWINRLSSAKGIASANWQQVADDIVRIDIVLHQNQHLGYSIGYTPDNKLLIVTKRLPEKPQLRDMLIAIDAGHGGTNVGASGTTTRILEKDYTLRFAQAFEKQLQAKNISYIMVRSADTTIDNKDRLLMLQPWQPDVLISFHLNSAGRESARGVSTYYKHLAFQPLTGFILQSLLEIPQLPEFGNVGSFNFQLVQPANYPSCLVEVAFLSNAQDEQLILSDAFQQRVAAQVYEGLMNWVKQLN